MPSVVTRRPPALVRVAAIALLAGATVGCAGEAGDPGDFAEAWDDAQALMPEQEQLTPGSEACSDALGDLRQARQDLPPAPSTGVTDALDEWFSIAEATLFDCPPSGGELDGFDDAYTSLAEAQRAVDAAVEEAGSGA